MEDFERYLDEIVEPTVQEFAGRASDVRFGFLTCVVIDHAVDYLAFPGERAAWDRGDHRRHRSELRQQFQKESAAFKLASEVGNAFKHVKTISERGLEASEVYERPPALAGRMIVGLSMVGDATGAVIVDDLNLLAVAQEALVFLRSKQRPA